MNRRIGIDEMRQGPVELEALGVRIEHGATDAERFGIGPQRLDPSGEALIHRALVGRDLIVGGGARRYGQDECGDDDGKGDQRASWHHHANPSKDPDRLDCWGPIVRGALRRRKGNASLCASVRARKRTPRKP